MPSADDPARAAATEPRPNVTRPAPLASPRQWTSEALLGGGREALIEHAGSVYRLRLTASGKLILTK